MEVLNLIIERNIKEKGGFNYHWGCDGLKISHVCFADDLMLFSQADECSVRILKESLEDFSGVSGLIPNLNKSTIYFGNVNNHLQHLIKGLLPFKVGVLPVRYLGIPLLSKRLYSKDCSVLIDKVRKKLNDWKNKFLSFDGRLQLIRHFNLYDIWCPLSPLCSFITVRDIHRPGLTTRSTVNEIVVNGGWSWPVEWQNKFPSLFNLNVPSLVDGKRDVLMWKSREEKHMPFCTSEVYKDLCVHRQSVQWAKVMWFSQSIPRHAFILWLAYQVRLLTQDRLDRWEVRSDLLCPFCQLQMDSHYHLFFECDYPSEVWDCLKGLGMLNDAPPNRKGCVDFLAKQHMGRSFRSIIQRLVLAAMFYFIWQERNLRLFQDKYRTVEELCKVIEKL
ncbi:uncharacterized protein LOC110914018 [Helianthus annuus]|uniref:uncharacterized protein LOC110914018 n=1 Tax=Helianthus annuus TaxID=4232 RepID=UPI000B8F5741|nr:uncharacterized protein LOC110914018 [Helianthus annuus]